MAIQKLTHETLIAYAAGELAPERVAEVEAVLRQSAGDVRRLERIRRMIDSMRIDDSVAPPAEALSRAKAIFQPSQRPFWCDWLDQLDTILANLRFDSRKTPALAGYRGTASAIQISFESEAADVDLELLPPAAAGTTQWTVMGQISTEKSLSEVQVALVSSADDTINLDIHPDEHGVFSAQTQPGEYDLLIRFSDVVLRLADITIG